MRHDQPDGKNRVGNIDKCLLFRVIGMKTTSYKGVNRQLIYDGKFPADDIATLPKE